MSDQDVSLEKIGDLAQGLSINRYRVDEVDEGLHERIINVRDLDQLYIRDKGDLSQVRLAKSNVDRYDRYRLQENDVVISRTGKPLKVSVVTKEAEGCLAGQNLIFFRIKRNDVNPVFLVALLRSRWMDRNLDFLYGLSSTIPSVKISQLRQLNIPLLEISAQEKIAQLFSATEHFTEAALEVIEVYQEIASLALLKILDK